MRTMVGPPRCNADERTIAMAVSGNGGAHGHWLAEQVPGHGAGDAHIHELPEPIAGRLEEDELVAARATAPAALGEAVHEDFARLANDGRQLGGADALLQALD